MQACKCTVDNHAAAVEIAKACLIIALLSTGIEHKYPKQQSRVFHPFPNWERLMQFCILTRNPTPYADTIWLMLQLLLLYFFFEGNIMTPPQPLHQLYDPLFIQWYSPTKSTSFSCIGDWGCIIKCIFSIWLALRFHEKVSTEWPHMPRHNEH